MCYKCLQQRTSGNENYIECLAADSKRGCFIRNGDQTRKATEYLGKNPASNALSFEEHDKFLLGYDTVLSHCQDCITPA